MNREIRDVPFATVPKGEKMSKVVIYQSGTGFTAKYANWIAERLGCEAKAYKEVNPSELSDYDM